jgi:hypothetical protein
VSGLGEQRQQVVECTECQVDRVVRAGSVGIWAGQIGGAELMSFCSREIPGMGGYEQGLLRIQLQLFDREPIGGGFGLNVLTRSVESTACQRWPP